MLGTLLVKALRFKNYSHPHPGDHIPPDLLQVAAHNIVDVGEG